MAWGYSIKQQQCGMCLDRWTVAARLHPTLWSEVCRKNGNPCVSWYRDIRMLLDPLRPPVETGGLPRLPFHHIEGADQISHFSVEIKKFQRIESTVMNLF